MNVVESNNLDFIVVAGDLLDKHDRIDVEPLNLAINFIYSLSEKVKTFILVGNHDYKNNQQFLSDHHWMNALKFWNNVTIVDDVIDLTLDRGLFKPKFLFVPYVPPGRFVEAIKTKMDTFDDYKAIFAHQEFYGCKMGPIESKCGDKWDEKWPTVVSGHIHNKQWSQKNIYYPGSAMQHAFGQSVDNTITLLTFSPEEPMVYEEIDLHMPKLVIKYLSIEDAMKPLEKKLNKRYKLVIHAPTQEDFLMFKKTLRYKQLLKEEFKIVFKLKTLLTKEPHELIKEERKKFLNILKDKIKEDKTLEKIFEKFII
jgi:DNA repair exonuclease SbcCD nuclease subunit